MRRVRVLGVLGVVGVLLCGASAAVAMRPAYASGRYYGTLTAPADSSSGHAVAARFPLSFRIKNGRVVGFRATFTCHEIDLNGSISEQRLTYRIRPALRIDRHGAFFAQENDDFMGSYGGVITVTGHLHDHRASGTLSYQYNQQTDHAQTTCETTRDERWTAAR